jgi:hypothetical protein
VDKTAAGAAPAQDVAKAVADALTARKPKTRYLAGKGAHPVAVAERTLPDRLKDLVVAHEAELPGPEKRNRQPRRRRQALAVWGRASTRSARSSAKRRACVL